MTSGKQGIAIEALRDALQGLQIPGSGSYLERDAPSQPLECFAGKPIGPTAREALLFPLFDNAMTGQAHQCTGGWTCSGNFRFCIGLPNRSPTIPRRRRTMRVRAVVDRTARRTLAPRRWPPRRPRHKRGEILFSRSACRLCVKLFIPLCAAR